MKLDNERYIMCRNTQTCAFVHADHLPAVRHANIRDETGADLAGPRHLVIARLKEEVRNVGDEEEDATGRRSRVRYRNTHHPHLFLIQKRIMSRKNLEIST